jgi:hypothetical protein
MWTDDVPLPGGEGAPMNDETNAGDWAAVPPAETPAAPSPQRSRPPLLRHRAAKLATMGGLALGGIAGGVVISHAATATATPSPSAAPGTGLGDGAGGPRGHAGLCMHGLQSEDLSLVAGAIGISSTDLQNALSSGQTIAAVAKAHNVDVDKVISAWVASENREIDARVAAGQITSAQATRMKAQTQQRVTDEVNGVHPDRGPGGPGGPGGPPAPGAGTGSSGGSTSTGTSA